ncbi:MAG: hypothetical protein SF069_11735 [Phycisphaerae bacterium]|nr:hypothetical protein [Phycisphaerae bacterium]
MSKMAALDWSKFQRLDGDPRLNFELLCRNLVTRHYRQFGCVRALRNQPGVEFHIQLHSACSLGDSGRWWGWQCKWFGVPSDGLLNNSQKDDIRQSLAQSKEKLPELTDWVLWTPCTLSKSSQEWYYSLSSVQPRLHLWSESELREHLAGPGAIMRAPYFGELALTASDLQQIHERTTAALHGRWFPEVHQVVAAEQQIRRALGETDQWSDLKRVASNLESGSARVIDRLPFLTEKVRACAAPLLDAARDLRGLLDAAGSDLSALDVDDLGVRLNAVARTCEQWNAFSRLLRAARSSFALDATNFVATVYEAIHSLSELQRSLARRVLAIVGEAGFGKSQLAAQVTAPSATRPAGILLFGRDLRSRENFDDLARRVCLHGEPVKTFESLVAAVDAAAQRASCRLPIIIDGLNEAEDARDWKGAIAQTLPLLQQYRHVLLVCTVRGDFVAHAIPDEVDRVHLEGFQEELNSAVARYFQHYRIDATDSPIDSQAFEHPLLLRMFCEVTNPARQKTVGVEAMPTSLTALFERFLLTSADRIAELAATGERFCVEEVLDALRRIAIELWDRRARAIPAEDLRSLLHDTGRVWERSIVRALEQEGLLFRDSFDGQQSGQYAVVYDALAGHMIADALVGRVGPGEFVQWFRLQSEGGLFAHGSSRRHPLASDIISGLVGVLPRRAFRQQLWLLLDEPLRSEALYAAARLEAEWLDPQTVAALESSLIQLPHSSRDLLNRMWATRDAADHPLNSHCLDRVLRAMPNAERDLRWSEWIRRHREAVVVDLDKIAERWKSGVLDSERERLLARWIMWTLTSTVRPVRDRATRALFRLGLVIPDALFRLTADSLRISDPYVSERTLAASYGVAMTLYCQPERVRERMQLGEFAGHLINEMFMPDAPAATWNALARDSALGVIELAGKMTPGCFGSRERQYLQPPFRIPHTPFRPPKTIRDADIAEARWAIDYDFDKYRIGGFAREGRWAERRGVTHDEVRRQVEARIVELGYEASRFGSIDEMITRCVGGQGTARPSRTDCYGKKYAWIAFLEMHGLSHQRGKAQQARLGRRPAEPLIDPSFPEQPRAWRPELPSLFADAFIDRQRWIAHGCEPDYTNLLSPAVVDGAHGPWVLLDGHVEQTAASDDRRVFTLFRGVLTSARSVRALIAGYFACPYPGNDAIPRLVEDYYTYWGEVSWSRRFASSLWNRNGRAKSDRKKAFSEVSGSTDESGVYIELPACQFIWESHHSELNSVSAVTVPAPALIEHLQLRGRPQELDFADGSGRVASLYREFRAERDAYASHLLYLRADLLAEYLRASNQSLVWMVWGERGWRFVGYQEPSDQEVVLLRTSANVHRRAYVWRPSASQPIELGPSYDVRAR